MDRYVEPLGILRKAQWRDADRLRLLHQLVLSRLRGPEYSGAQMRALMERMPTLDPHLIRDQTYFVHEVGGAIVACGGWSTHTPQYARLMAAHDGVDARPPAAYIRAMYTHPEWTRRGLGRRIIAAAEREIRAAGLAAIELDAMLTGVPLFRAVGYRGGSTTRLELGNGIDFPLLKMTKELVPSAAGAAPR